LRFAIDELLEDAVSSIRKHSFFDISYTANTSGHCSDAAAQSAAVSMLKVSAIGASHGSG
jgi:hypothetical protein